MGFATSPPPRSPSLTGSSTFEELSPAAADRVFPIRSVVSVDPNPTTAIQSDVPTDSYFPPTETSSTDRNFRSDNPTTIRSRHTSAATSVDYPPSEVKSTHTASSTDGRLNAQKPRHSADVYSAIAAAGTSDDGTSRSDSITPGSQYAPASVKSTRSVANNDEIGNGLMTARFKHVVTEGGHMVITGRGGDTLQRCEDEPIHIPGAIQNFGLLMALEEVTDGRLIVRLVSENSARLIGYSPKQLFQLESFTDVLTDDQADNLLDHIDFIRDEDVDVVTNGPEVFTMSIKPPRKRTAKLWCAMHINDSNPNIIICEFELEDDPDFPLVPPNDATPDLPEDTLESDPTPQEYADSTENTSRPLRVLRSARKRKGEAAAMEVFNIMSQVQEQLAAAPNLERFLKTLVGVVKELTGFHRVMIYQFDQNWNGRVVTELVDPRATRDLYKGLNFPASDIPKQARDLYKLNKVRMLYDRDAETARLVCRTMEDLENPLDLTYSYLRAMSPIHIKYLANMAVRSSMSISINAFEELWGLIACHAYGPRGLRVSFPIRKMCRLIGDSASRNIERLSYASRLQARKLINTVPTQGNPSGYIIASSEDLLTLFNADFGMLSIRDETKVLGTLEQSQEALAMLEYLRMRRLTSVMTSQDVRVDFPDLRYPPGFKVIAGLLLVPLAVGGQDFIVFFRKGQLKEVKWAGNPYEKFVKEGTEGYLEPRKSFKTWSETVVGKCREWTEEEIETAAVLCLVYGKFIEVWRQKEAALHNSQLNRLLLANSAHEVRTPLNAIINYLEIALEGTLDSETRDNLAKSHSASKSLIYVINDLLDLTNTEEGGELIKDEVFDLTVMLKEATDPYSGDAKRKNIAYEVVEHPGLPEQVSGDQRKVRQAISNVTANAIQNTAKGKVTVEMYVATRTGQHVDLECSVTDTGAGISGEKLDALFRELEQVQSEGAMTESSLITGPDPTQPSTPKDGRTLGLGLAIVARIIRNMNGQMRLKSEEGKGSRFVLQFPFEVPTTPGQPPVMAGEGEQAGVSQQNLHTDEVTLIERTTPALSPIDTRVIPSRRNSEDSAHSRHSRHSLSGSMRSNVTQASNKSEADRLIEAIQESHNIAGSPSSSNSPQKISARGGQNSINNTVSTQRRSSVTTGFMGTSPTPGAVGQSQRRSSTELSRPRTSQEREIKIGPPGWASIPDQGTPVKSIRVSESDDLGVSTSHSPSPNVQRSSAMNLSTQQLPESESSQASPTSEHMRVLVAEDDPVNSKIIQKRLQKLGHEIVLTVNGEECASMYGEKAGFFDVILMDMQVWFRVNRNLFVISADRCRCRSSMGSHRPR